MAMDPHKMVVASHGWLPTKKVEDFMGYSQIFSGNRLKYHPQNDCNAIIWSLLERPWPF